MKESFKALKGLLVLVKGMSGWMSLAILCGVLGFVSALAIPLCAAWSVLSIAQGNISVLNWSVWVMLACGLLRGILRYAEQACNHYIAFKLLAHIRDLVYGKLRELGPARLEGRKKGDLIALITSDVELLEVFYAHTISPACIAFVCSIVFSIPAFMIHWLAGVCLLISFFVCAVCIPAAVAGNTQKAGAAFRKKSGQLSGLVLENVWGLKENLQFSTVDTRQKEIVALTQELEKEEEKIKGSEAAITSMMQWTNSGFCFLMLIVCGILMAQKAIDPYMTIFLLVLQASAFGPFAALANLGAGLAQTLASAVRVTDLLNESPMTPEIIHGVPAQNGPLALEVVSFGYEPDKKVLDHASYQFEQGKITAISGPSGCGKSTTLRLLMRFWDPERGQVSLNGTNLKKITTNSLRDHQAFMMQDTVLFHDTIAENLKIAKEDATLSELEDACKKASIHDFIMTLPNGYETKIGEDGCTFSAGERQRLGLARAFLSNADILLLDEPTSNLDALNEGAILQAIDSFKKQKTVVLVSHKKGTLGFADHQIRMQRQEGE